MSSQPGYIDGAPIAADWWRRLVAWLVDGVVVGLACSVIFYGLLAAATLANMRNLLMAGGPPDPILQIVRIGIFTVVPFFYFWPLHASMKGQTLGKKLTGIRVVKTDLSPLSGSDAAVRALAYPVLSWFAASLYIGVIYYLIDALWPLFDRPRGRALHDMMAKTLVIRVQRG